jgi:hypothetical protein
MLPDWLSAPLTLNGTLSQDYEKLYRVFQTDLFHQSLEVEGIPIIINPALDPDMPQYERGFTHLVTREDASGLRSIDHERATRLHWVAPLITHYKDPAVRSFWSPSPRRGERLYIWLYEHDYVLVLNWTSSSQNRKILLTAYHVDRHRRVQFQRYYENATRILS